MEATHFKAYGSYLLENYILAWHPGSYKKRICHPFPQFLYISVIFPTPSDLSSPRYPCRYRLVCISGHFCVNGTLNVSFLSPLVMFYGLAVLHRATADKATLAPVSMCLYRHTIITLWDVARRECLGRTVGVCLPFQETIKLVLVLAKTAYAPPSSCSAVPCDGPFVEFELLTCGASRCAIDLRFSNDWMNTFPCSSAHVYLW